MCYKRPGPRCSSHTREQFDLATLKYENNPTPANKRKLEEAEEAWLRSPEGIKYLAESEDEDRRMLAMQYSQDRMRMIQDYHASRNAENAHGVGSKWQQAVRAFGDRVRKTTDTSGSTVYMKGHLRHREDGPAIIYTDGSEAYYVEGELHRLDGPAVINADGGVEYWVGGVLHREGGLPAVIKPDGTEYYYEYGMKHRDGDLPAETHPNGMVAYYQRGRLHRDGDNPALTFNDGSQSWYKDGLLHRDGDKPAVVLGAAYKSGAGFSEEGTQRWYKNNVPHRDGGKPSVVTPSGNEEYRVDGVLHRTDGPARMIKYGDGSQSVQYRINGRLHRTDGPALIKQDGTEEWWENEKLIKRISPAIVVNFEDD